MKGVASFAVTDHWTDQVESLVSAENDDDIVDDDDDDDDDAHADDDGV